MNQEGGNFGSREEHASKCENDNSTYSMSPTLSNTSNSDMNDNHANLSGDHPSTSCSPVLSKPGNVQHTDDEKGNQNSFNSSIGFEKSPFFNSPVNIPVKERRDGCHSPMSSLIAMQDLKRNKDPNVNENQGPSFGQDKCRSDDDDDDDDDDNEEFLNPAAVEAKGIEDVYKISHPLQINPSKDG